MSISKKIGATALVIATAIAMAGCSGSSTTNPAAGNADSTVVVGTWGGDFQKYLKDFVGPEVAKEKGAPKVIYAVGDDTSRLAKLRAEKDGKAGSMDIIVLNNIQMQQAVQADLLEKLDTTKIPNLANLQAFLDNPYWVAQIYSPNVIIYNTEKVNPAPTSYEDLFDPKYAGKIGIQSVQSQDFFHAAATLAQGKNAVSDWMSGLPLLEKLAPNTQVFSSQEQISSALMSGQIWMTLNWKARAVPLIETSKTPLATAVPKEGTYATQFVMAIPKNAPHKEAAYAYLNALLAPAAQLGFSQKMGYLPAVTNSGISSELAEKIGVPKKDEGLIAALDVDDIATTYGDVVTA